MSNVYMVDCSVPFIELEDRAWYNHVVNLSFCKSILKVHAIPYKRSVEGWGLQFVGCNVTWLFPDKEARDKELESIMRRIKIRI